jgi:hypothetical protein
MVAALTLLAAAIVSVLRQGEALKPALAAVGRPQPLSLALLVGGVAANVLLTGVMFSLLTRRYGRVGLLEMQALVASATLLNYLPLRPGLLGRIAYHKAVNQILAIDSAKVLLQASLISIALVSYLALAVFISAELALPLIGAVALPAPLLLIAMVVPALRTISAAALVRYLEVLVWATRYWAAFQLIGAPVSPMVALTFACISMVATMIPFISNGLGLREWAIGLAAPLLTAYQLQLGITAELVNRAAELVVIACLGLIGVAWLAHRRKHYAARAGASR